MVRPNRVWCGVVVGLGILAGCGKKPAETVSGNTDPTPAPSGGSKADMPANKGRVEKGPPANGGQAPEFDFSGVVAALGKKSDEGTQAKPPGAPNPPMPEEKGPSLAAGAVAVTQCKFEGVEKAIAAARGKVVLIDCWATWCGPCVASFPKLVEKHQKYETKGLAVISLSTDKVADAPKVIAFLKKQNATFTNLHMPLDAAGANSMQQKFAYRNAIPHAVLFDKAGKKVWSGHPMDAKLTPLIESELAKGAAAP